MVDLAINPPCIQANHRQLLEVGACPAVIYALDTEQYFQPVPEGNSCFAEDGVTKTKTDEPASKKQKKHGEDKDKVELMSSPILQSLQSLTESKKNQMRLSWRRRKLNKPA